MHLPGSVAFRQIVVGILEERRGKKRKENLQGSRLFFPCPIRRRYLETWDGVACSCVTLGRGGLVNGAFLWLVLLDCACF